MKKFLKKFFDIVIPSYIVLSNIIIIFLYLVGFIFNKPLMKSFNSYDQISIILSVCFNIFSAIIFSKLLFQKLKAKKIKNLKWAQAILFLQIPVIYTPLLLYYVNSVGSINLYYNGSLWLDYLFKPFTYIRVLPMLQNSNFPIIFNFGINLIPLVLLIYFAQRSKYEKLSLKKR